MMAADDGLAAFDAAQSWGDAMKALNEWREKAENTPPEALGGPVSDFPCSGAPWGGSSPADGPQWRDRGAIIATLTAEVEQLKAEVVRTNDRFAKARVRNGELRTRAEAAERARDDALARESRLREAVEALADEWERSAESHDKAGRRYFDRGETSESIACAALAAGERNAAIAVRALLAVQDPPAATEDTPTEQGEGCEDGECVHLDGYLSAPATAQCSGCGRMTWDEALEGTTCGMPQPAGTLCPGVFADPPRTSGATEGGGE